MAQHSDDPTIKIPHGITRGRGAVGNPKNRFRDYEQLPFQDDTWAIDPDADPQEAATRPGLKTRFYKDSSRTIVASNDSPDIGFTYSVNSYRGCEHGCIYCYARPTHEYFGLSAGLDFETKIFVKTEAPKLLRTKLMSRSWKPGTIAMSGVTDCYQPIEKRLQLTRGCLEVLLEFRNPVFIITKNFLVTRDIDLLRELAAYQAGAVIVSVTSLDRDLCGKLEPRTSRPEMRLRAVSMLAEAGVPVGINIAPVIPGLNDHEIPAILKAAADAGAKFAHYTLVRLPYAVKDLFVEWLGVHFPDRQKKVVHKIQELRGGKLNDPDFGSRMRGQGEGADQLRRMFDLYCRRERLNSTRFDLTARNFRRPGSQAELFPHKG